MSQLKQDTESDADAWILHWLKEQVQLLEFLLVFFYQTLACPPEYFSVLLKAFRVCVGNGDWLVGKTFKCCMRYVGRL